MESIRMNPVGLLGIECLNIREDIVNNLQMRANGIVRTNNLNVTMPSAKCCPTRHGCTGATNCDCSLSDYSYGR